MSKVTFSQLSEVNRKYLDKVFPYKMVLWSDFDYTLLDKILYRKKAGRGDNSTYNDVIIMLDTETSKKHNNATYIENGKTRFNPVDNYVVAFTISLRAFNRNIVTLYGHRPDDCVECISQIHNSMKGFETIFYIHNMSYDWIFLRKFMFLKYGFPDKQLNTKSHYPIFIKWESGIIFKDSLILSQRSLDKWAKDMNVEHQKAVGKWDYNLIRNQNYEFSVEELEYIENDTLAGVECIDTLLKQLNKSLYSMPYTATGIPREAVRKLAKENSGKERFLSMCLNYEQYRKAENVYHGGYTHANRHITDVVLTDGVKCYDFSSSYPYVMLSEKYPMEKFMPIDNKDIDFILRNMNEYAFMFKLILIKPRLKNDFQPMPSLQYSKCTYTINAVLDNGRILCAEYVEIYLTELDLYVINQQYDYDKHICTEIELAKKEYLPRWFTDYIFSLYKDKTLLKGGDPVLYSIRKATLNSVYGMCVQKSIRENISEQYLTGEYQVEITEPEEDYEKYLNNRNSILPYQWGVWVTAYAFRNLFALGQCCETWVYSDTDSCYGINWNNEKLSTYNSQCVDKLKNNGYGAVNFNGQDYYLGVAEFDGSYSEYVVQHAKCYCGRSEEDNKLHITVAGVPKKTGAICLNDDINNFTAGFIFDGDITGKLTHTYNYVDEIYTDSNGNIISDSVDLTKCDYLLSGNNVVDWEDIFSEEIEVIVYE